MRRRFERNGTPRNGNGHSDHSDVSEAPSQPEFEVFRQSIGGMHWYEQIARETREHLDWWQSVSHYTGRGRPMPVPLLNWYAEKGAAEAERLKIQGGIRGSAVHRAQQDLTKGLEIRRRDYSDEVIEHVVSIRRWFEDHFPEFVSCEEIVYDPELRVGGTLDLTYVLPAKTCEKLKIDTKCIRDAIGGVLVVHDTKTGKVLDEDNWIQANQYGEMRNGMGLTHHGVPVEWVALLRTNSKHKCGYEYVIEPMSQTRSHVFRCMKTTVDHFEPMAGPRFPKQLPESISLPLPQNGESVPEPARERSRRSRR